MLAGIFRHVIIKKWIYIYVLYLQATCFNANKQERERLIKRAKHCYVSVVHRLMKTYCRSVILKKC